MAEWSVSASTPAETDAAQLFAKELAVEVRRPGFWGQFMGKGPNNIIEIKDNFKKEKGDVINFGLVINMSNAPIHDDGWLEDNEESLTTYFDSVKLDIIMNAFRLKGKLNEQRVPYNIRKTAKDALRAWYVEQFDTWIFKKLSGETYQGYPGTSRGTKGSLETIGEAGTANTNVIYGGDATATADIDSADTFTLDLVDKAKTVARTGISGGSSVYKVNPVLIDGKRYYVCVLHPWQVYDLKQSSEWKQIMREAEVRGKENPIFSGALGIYNGVVFYEHEYIRTASNWGVGANVSGATALFLGAQAGLLAKAQEGPDWMEANHMNYGYKWGVATGMVMGFDKATFNSKDFGVIAIKTAAADPTA